MKLLSNLARRTAMLSCLTLSIAAISGKALAAPSGSFIPSPGPSLPDFGFGGTDPCRPIGSLPDFCIPGIGPSIPDPFGGIDADSAIEIRYRVVNTASEFGEVVADPTLSVFATKMGSGEFYEEQRRGWVVLPGPGVYTFSGESAFCVIETKKVRVTAATRSVSLKAVCE